MDNQPIITFRGEKVALGPVRKDLLPLYQLWMNQPGTTRFLRMGIYSLENEQQWYEGVASGDGIAYFTIYELASMKPIGGVDLHAIDTANRTAELGIMIGDAESRGKGYGTEAVRLMCDWGFNAMGLNSIMLLTFAWNIAGQKAYTRAGFREFGRRRDARWFAGQYWDDIYYDILADEFDSPVVRDMILEGVEFPPRSS
jgi:RimJ/RimL family protein N-acetyltransferase